VVEKSALSALARFERQEDLLCHRL